MRKLPALIGIVAAAAVSISPLIRACHGQDSVRLTQAPSTRLVGLQVAQAKRTSAEGKDGIEITFDKLSAERVRQFTQEVVGRRVVFIVNQRRLATLRLLDPITKDGVLLTGELDHLAVDALFSPGAVVDLTLE